MQENELKNGQNVPPQDEAAQQAPAPISTIKGFGTTGPRFLKKT